MVASNRTTYPREGACLPINMMNVRDSDKRLSDSLPHSIKILFTDHMILYYTQGLCQESIILLGEGGKEKA